MRARKDTTIPGCLMMLTSWVLYAAGFVTGIWVGLDIALDGEIAKGIGIGLAIITGGAILAIVVGLIGFAFATE